MARDDNYRAHFISTSLELVMEYGFEGIDIDWEYPGSRGGIPEDKVNTF